MAEQNVDNISIDETTRAINILKKIRGSRVQMRFQQSH